MTLFVKGQGTFVQDIPRESEYATSISKVRFEGFIKISLGYCKVLPKNEIVC